MRQHIDLYIYIFFIIKEEKLKNITNLEHVPSSKTYHFILPVNYLQIPEKVMSA